MEVAEEEEPEELEESDERKIETQEIPDAEENEEEVKKEPFEGSEYRVLHTLSGLLHENEKALNEHENVMSKELHNSVRVLSKARLVHAGDDVKQKRNEQLAQHKQKLTEYQKLTDKHKELVGNFMQAHASVLENYVDPGQKFAQLLARQNNVVKQHDENIAQHEAFLNIKR